MLVCLTALCGIASHLPLTDPRPPLSHVGARVHESPRALRSLRTMTTAAEFLIPVRVVVGSKTIVQRAKLFEETATVQSIINDARSNRVTFG